MQRQADVHLVDGVSYMLHRAEARIIDASKRRRSSVTVRPGPSSCSIYASARCRHQVQPRRGIAIELGSRARMAAYFC
ncbi:hypothetical protein BD626DRAFT_512175, partial [Schizophyllum amplum]